MSYAIIRNVKYTRSNIGGIYRHNERINRSYSNKNINHTRTYLNYAIKPCPTSYVKKFDQIKKTHNLKGYLKSNSNIACEYVITSDEVFFKKIGSEETKRYFNVAYEFVKNYKNLGDDYIISANVHMDEATPHMHLVFIPVVHKINKKTGEIEDKISCSEFWKGKNSYRNLQNSFYEYVTRAGFKLERGDNKNNKHIDISKLKKITNYEEIQELINENEYLKQYIEKTYECVSILFDWPIDRLKRTINNFVKENEKNESITNQQQFQDRD